MLLAHWDVDKTLDFAPLPWESFLLGFATTALVQADHKHAVKREEDLFLLLPWRIKPCLCAQDIPVEALVNAVCPAFPWRWNNRSRRIASRGLGRHLKRLRQTIWLSSDWSRWIQANLNCQASKTKLVWWPSNHAWNESRLLAGCRDQDFTQEK